ncbi:MAG: hypothetical protein PHU85_00640 [Phycisphaerae bacterium]|nr:hypothetical protein [Phycisphaerae bacterium]
MEDRNGHGMLVQRISELRGRARDYRDAAARLAEIGHATRAEALARLAEGHEREAEHLQRRLPPALV